MLKNIGNIENKEKEKIIMDIIEKINEKYSTIEGEAYIGYPIYIDEYTDNKICVDLAIISRIGVFIFNILLNSVTSYSKIQDDIYVKVENKFRKRPFLMEKRKLAFDMNIITYSKEKMEKYEDYPIAFTIDDILNFIEVNKQNNKFSDELYNNILSGLQEAYGINQRTERDGVGIGTKAYLINEMNKLVEKYDTKQMEAILSDTKGIQRIRGMAGSGKTIVLARKAVELHMAHREWIIVVTYSTRALRDQLVNLISKFYAIKNDGAKYDKSKIKVMQAWGSATASGVYYEICLRHGVTPLNYNQARDKYNNMAFSKACLEVIKEVKKFQKMYDCILIDEAQDFDKNFMNLCLNVLGDDQRLVYAYDELQKLNEETMPLPKEIFGQDIRNDTPLTVCYRNQSNTIVTAHAIGMGLYRKNDGLIQIPGSSDVWETIGYTSDRKIVEGESVELYRTKETSPELLKCNPEEIIYFYKYDNFYSQSEFLLKMIKENINQDQLIPNDIMIIDMDTIGINNNINKISAILLQRDEYKDISIHLAGTVSPEDFFRKDSIVYSTIFRAKGNEAYMVYIINAQRCANSLTPRSDRNALFTAITRSKGWVRVLGYGEEMQVLCDEFNEIKKHNFRLYFEHYPTKEEQKQLILNNQDLDEGVISSLNNTRNLINKLKADGKVTNIQIIKEIFGISSQEEIEELFKNGDEKNDG